MQKFIIEGRLPGYNELNHGHWAKRQKTKRDAMDGTQWFIKKYKIKPVGKAQITITCYEPNARRDEDNVLAGACKIILDALQRAKIIAGDGRKYIELVTKPVEIDRENPRIEVEIREL